MIRIVSYESEAQESEKRMDTHRTTSLSQRSPVVLGVSLVLCKQEHTVERMCIKKSVRVREDASKRQRNGQMRTESRVLVQVADDHNSDDDVHEAREAALLRVHPRGVPAPNVCTKAKL